MTCLKDSVADNTNDVITITNAEKRRYSPTIPFSQPPTASFVSEFYYISNLFVGNLVGTDNHLIGKTLTSIKS